jgi:hypothetical protein
MGWLRALLEYFDLRKGSGGLEAEAAGQFASVWPQYIAVAAGVVVEPYLRRYIEKETWSFDLSTFAGRLLFGLFIAIILLPAVYRSAFDPDKPVIVQLAALFPMGIGWQSLVNVGTTLVTAPGGG